jgi:hypothetical protein
MKCVPGEVHHAHADKIVGALTAAHCDNECVIYETIDESQIETVKKQDATPRKRG